MSEVITVIWRRELEKLGINRVDGIVLDLECHPISWTRRSGASPTGWTLPWTCVWIRDRRRRRGILSTGIRKKELYRVIHDLGEERFAGNIAKHIAAAREKKPIETTGELTEIIRGAIPAKLRAVGGHPAKRTFQAIRIELNQELEVLKNSLDDMIDLLNPGGRICVITFHSLEDRIVKTIFKTNENPCTCPSNFPVCVCGKKPKGRTAVKKPILPGPEELERNKRAKSAKLRVFERI